MGRLYQGSIVVLLSVLNHFAGHNLLLTLQERLKRGDCFETPKAIPQQKSTPIANSIDLKIVLDIPARRADRFPSLDERLKVKRTRSLSLQLELSSILSRCICRHGIFLLVKIGIESSIGVKLLQI